MNGMMSVDLPGIPKIRSGKVREVFDLGETLLIVATDRISAFDCILPDPIPGKGEILTQLSAFWFQKFHQIQNHFITADFEEFPRILEPHSKLLARPFDARPKIDSTSNRMRRSRLPCWIGLEGISGNRNSMRHPFAPGPGTSRTVA